MRHERCAQVLERRAASGVIEMAMAVGDIFDRRLGHGMDSVDIGA